jgi:hypothetical protein
MADLKEDLLKVLQKHRIQGQIDDILENIFSKLE